MPRSNLKLIQVSMESLSEFEQSQLAESADPLDLYMKKIEDLASVLDCTEEEAERIILGRVGSFSS